MQIAGGKACHAIAYMRGEDIAAIVPRLVKSLNGDWQQTAVTLPEGSWTNRLTGGARERGGGFGIQEALKDFPRGAAGEGRERGRRSGISQCMSFSVWAPRAKRVAGEGGRGSARDAGGRTSAAGGVRRWRTQGRARTMAFCWTTIRMSIPIRAACGSRNGVHGMSRVYDQSGFAWTDEGWQATAAGQFHPLRDACGDVLRRAGRSTRAIERLDQLAELGITHLELMAGGGVSPATGDGAMTALICLQ